MCQIDQGDPSKEQGFSPKEDWFYQNPPDYASLGKKIYALQERYRFLKCITIGKSVLGRGIFALILGEETDSVLLVGGVHGSEWITVLLLLRFCEELCHAVQIEGYLGDIPVKKALEGRSVIWVPCLNPDGTEIAIQGAKAALSLEKQVEEIWAEAPKAVWQANGRGVDLNHNFDAGWHILKQMEKAREIHGPAPTQYGGEAPHSEPETQALVRLCTDDSTFSIRQAYAYHAQGEEIYYKYGENTPASSALAAQILGISSGYKVCTPEGMASHGGFKDWFIETLHRPGFTIEVGKGKNPLPLSDLEPLYARLQEMMVLSLLL